jgi:translation initiation factor 2B subunit (eIF-2B alpha/beta/delta family)
VLENFPETGVNDYFDELLGISKRLCNAQLTMAPVLNAVNSIILEIKNSLPKITSEVGKDKEKQLQYLCILTQKTARKYILVSQLALETIARSYTEVIHDNDFIMTISASSVVEKLLSEAHNDGLDITIYTPESRPMNEGSTLALRLADNGIKTNLIADHGMFQYLNKCNKIIVGADRVHPGGIINKIGTYGLAIASKELNIPFYCVCELAKFVPDIMPFDELIRSHPESEILVLDNDQIKPENLSVNNIYFDFTPMKFLTGFLTENGLLTPDQTIDHIKTVELMPQLTKMPNKE